MKPLFRVSLALLFLQFASTVMAQTASLPYTFVDRASVAFTTSTDSGPVIGGYGLIQPGGGTTEPSGLAIFGYRENGVLVTEAGVPAMVPILSGRTYAEVNGPIDTGIAIANPNALAITIQFHFTDQSGNDFGANSFTMNAGTQMARFLNQAPFNAAGAFAGTFSFSASAPVGIIALRGFTNERGDFTITTQTVASISTQSSAPLILPHFADGGGWKTEVLLVNPTEQLISGTMQFYGDGTASAAATALTLSINGQSASSFNYAVPARSSVNMTTSGFGPAQVGSVHLTPAGGTSAPSALAYFSYTENGITVTQASIPGGSQGSSFRAYVESVGATGSNGSIQSAIAIANTSTTAATVNYELIDASGSTTGLTGSLIVPASGHTSKFLRELLPSAPLTFQGMLRITSSQGSIVVMALRTRYNERGELLITTTPPSNEADLPSTSPMIFPHIADNGGYSTEFILFSATPGQSPLGSVQFFNQAGQPWSLTLH